MFPAFAKGRRKVEAPGSSLDGDDTMVTLWNPADEAQDFVFTLSFSGGHYNLPIHLDSKATRMFTISELVQNQVADDEGNVIPASVHEGSGKLSGPLGENQHILVTLDVGIYNVRKATCKYSCNTCHGAVFNPVPWIVDDPWAVGVGGNHNLTFHDQWDTGHQYDLTSSSTWSSTANNIATVSTGLVHGVAAGAATMGASNGFEPWAGQQCGSPPQQCPPDQGVDGGGSGSAVSAQVTTVNLPSDTVTVSLSGPPSASGQLVVTWNGPGPNPAIANASEGPGTYTFNPSLGGLQPGQYTGVGATWTVNGTQATGSETYNFNVLGTWRHSQYNTPTESSCSGSSSPAYEVNVTTCAYQTNNLIAQFISQSWLNGSGKTINSYYGYNPEQNAQWCINHNYLPGDATGKSFAFEPNIIPYCGSGYSLGTTTVAWNFSSTQTLNCNDQVLIVGLGAGAGTVKTVTDKCGAACSNTQLDNYTTTTGCDPHNFNDLGNFTTIRLGR